MRTSKSFATIDYNSRDFLIVKLSELVRNGTLDFWAFIEHLPEDDETKKHKHLFCVPSGRMDTAQLLSYLEEIDPQHPDKPLRCLACRSSKFDDWYQYALHDTVYLASKGQSRRYHYRKEEIICSDEDYLSELIHQIDYSKLARINALKQAVADGISFPELVSRGQIPIQQINQYSLAYDMFFRLSTSRNGREGHEELPNADPLTGELLPDTQKE